MNFNWKVLTDSELTTSTKLVFFALVELASNHPKRLPGETEIERGQVAVTIKELASMIGLNDKTVPKCLRALEKKGLILIDQKQRFHCCYVMQRVYQIIPLQQIIAEQFELQCQQKSLTLN